MSILEHFTETVNSDNRFQDLNIEDPDEITVGATCTHVFILPFKYSEYVTNSKVLYKQGIDTVLEKYPADYSLTELDNGTTVLSLKLSAADTLLFNRPEFKTYVQIKIETVTNEILYNELSRLIVKVPVADINEPNQEGN